MKKLSYKKLVRKITDNRTNLNSEFYFYNYHIILQSGTVDYVNVVVRNEDLDYYLNFSFDFWTKELVFFTYNIDILKIIEFFKFFYGGNIKTCFDFEFNSEIYNKDKFQNTEIKLINMLEENGKLDLTELEDNFKWYVEQNYNKDITEREEQAVLFFDYEKTFKQNYNKLIL